MNEEAIYQVARKRFADKKDFLRHLMVYAVANAMLVAIWAISGRGYGWFVGHCWTGAWGLSPYGLRVFVFDRQGSWECTGVEKEVARPRSRK